jgi:hypothetical protein
VVLSYVAAPHLHPPVRARCEVFVILGEFWDIPEIQLPLS